MMRLSLLLAALSLAWGSGLRKYNDPPSSSCDKFDNLPDECDCQNGVSPHSLFIECLKPYNNTFLNDTIGIKLVIEPCDPKGSRVALDVTDTAHDIDFAISEIRAGEKKIIPIPGIAVAVPEIGHIGVDAVVDVAGTPDLLLLNVGLDACVALRHKFICAESLPYLNDMFPWWIVSGNYSFGDYCSTPSVTAIA